MYAPNAVFLAPNAPKASGNETCEFRSAGRRGRSETDRGKYLVVWTKQPNGEWKVAADMFNSDLQPAK